MWEYFFSENLLTGAHEPPFRHAPLRLRLPWVFDEVQIEVETTYSHVNSSRIISTKIKKSVKEQILAQCYRQNLSDQKN